MNHARLLQMLNEDLSNNDPATPFKAILRFQSPELYEQCLDELRHMRSVCQKLSAVQPVESIHAMVCALHSTEAFEAFGDQLRIERDAAIHLHVKGFNPMNPGANRNAPRGFDKRQKIPWGVRQIKAPLIWGKTMGSRIKIGVVDTGVDFSHPDLGPSLARGVNLLNRFSLPMDDNGHGTHIAGTIAAYNRLQGMTGVAPKAIIHPVKAFDRYGSAYVSDIIMGIDWCVANDIDIINMSFGMKQHSQALQDAVTAAYRAGVVIVSSSGNDGRRNVIDYPAGFPQTIAVGATNRKNRIASFSNRSREIDVYAPGSRIYSTWPGGRYNELSGTSMATSHVSGLIALMLAYHSGLTPKKIKRILKISAAAIRTAADKPAPQGMVQAMRMMNVLKRMDRTKKKKARRRSLSTLYRSSI